MGTTGLDIKPEDLVLDGSEIKAITPSKFKTTIPKEREEDLLKLKRRQAEEEKRLRKEREKQAKRLPDVPSRKPRRADWLPNVARRWPKPLPKAAIRLNCAIMLRQAG